LKDFFISGTFGATDRLSSASECSPCRGGSYCDIPGLSTPRGPCSPGYYCTEGITLQIQTHKPHSHYRMCAYYKRGFPLCFL